MAICQSWHSGISQIPCHLLSREGTWRQWNRGFLTRMPINHYTKAGTRATEQSSSSISIKMSRFRAEKGILSWIARYRSQTTGNALWERLPEQSRQENSNGGLQPPTLDEQQEIRNGKRGKFFSHAGKRALNSKERNRRHEILGESTQETPRGGTLRNREFRRHKPSDNGTCTKFQCPVEESTTFDAEAQATNKCSLLHR